MSRKNNKNPGQMSFTYIGGTVAGAVKKTEAAVQKLRKAMRSGKKIIRKEIR